jgi:zinc transport system substrate-binding protein
MRAACAVALCLLLGAPAQAREQSPAPKVVTSIKPVHAIAAAVMAGASAPGLLAVAGSPHSYALKPSDARKLADADVIFWIGPELETFLARPLANSRARSVPVGRAAGIRRLPAREGGVWEDAHDDHADGHDLAGGPVDPHLWLDPRNAIVIARAMAGTLGAIDPSRAALYRGNADAFAARVTRLDAELAGRLGPVKNRPYIVLHDAYHYFEDRYGLSPAGAVTVAADRPVGARRLETIRARIRSAAVTCVVTPPQVTPRLLAAITQGTPVRVAAIDDLGADIPAGPALYETLLRRMGEGFAACLGV